MVRAGSAQRRGGEGCGPCRPRAAWLRSALSHRAPRQRWATTHPRRCLSSDASSRSRRCSGPPCRLTASCPWPTGSRTSTSGYRGSTSMASCHSRHRHQATRHRSYQAALPPRSTRRQESRRAHMRGGERLHCILCFWGRRGLCALTCRNRWRWLQCS
jgi:hypothetical protein